MTALNRAENSFKKAMIFSLAAHIVLFMLLWFSPHFPKPSQKGMIHYIDVISLAGGGGGSSGGSQIVKEQVAETAVPPRESLRDLTTPQVIPQENPASFRYPVEKPKKEKKPQPKKKAVIQRPQKPTQKNVQNEKEASQSGTASGTGSGVQIGIGKGTGSGGGLGSEFSSQIGLSHFPYTYYLEIIQSRISNNWLKSQVSSGTKKDLYTTVYFKIYKDGHISAVDIEESSGINSLDLSAKRAVTSSRFPPLPSAYEYDFLGIHLIFWHSK